MAVMVPVACWQDGTKGGHYIRFTESWRDMKTDGWGISAEGVKGDDDKLHAALKLIDFAYSPEGMVLMNCGPDAFFKTNADGSYATFLYNGQEMPEIADAVRDELWEKADGNCSNYARQFMGCALNFVKNQAFEYQCSTDAGREGLDQISRAIALGTIEHPEYAVTENPWYMFFPTILPNTNAEKKALNAFTLLKRFSISKGGENLFLDEIVNGYTEKGMENAEASAATVADDWGGRQYLALKTDAWNRLLNYYKRSGTHALERLSFRA